MSDNNASTLGGIINSATGAVQSAIGQLTGSGKDFQDGEAKRDIGESQKEASHATAKLGPVTATGEGGAHVDNADRQQGSWDQTLGSGKQFVGGLVGSESLKSEGQSQYEAGVARETQGQATDLASGLTDRVKGSLGGIGAAITDDREAQARYQEQHDAGKAAQRSVEYDLQKKAEAEDRRNY